MLVLTRKTEEKIYVGNDIVITIVQVKGDRVRLGIEAPKHVRVLREEVAHAIQREEQQQTAELRMPIDLHADAANTRGQASVGKTVVNANASLPHSSPLASRIAHRRMLGDGLSNLTIEAVDDSGIAARRAPDASFATSNRFSQQMGPASLMEILNRFKDQK